MTELEELYKIMPLYRELFLEQLEFLLLPSRFIAALCSRRAGKTTMAAVKAFQDLIMKPGQLGLYLALTDKSVEDIFLPVARPILDRYKVKCTIKSDEIEFSNGSKLLLLGANHINKIESFRGVKLSFCIIDEAASFKDKILHYLVDEIIGPALLDTQGQLILIGTPANHCSGLFYNITNDKEAVWLHRHWTGFGNPHIRNNFKKDALLFLQRKKCDESNPKYRREYLGEWCADTESLMIRMPMISQLQPYRVDTHRSVLGVDFGYNDETVFSIVGWKRNSKTSYVYESFGKAGLNVTQIANILKHMQQQYAPLLVVADPAGASKIMIEEFVTKHGIAMQPAQKTNKAHYVEILNDAIINHKLILNRESTQELQNQIKKVVWNEDRTREHEGQPCDHIDALLYAFRESFAYIEQITEHKVKTDAEAEKEMLEEQVAAYQAEQHKDDFYQEISYVRDDLDYWR